MMDKEERVKKRNLKAERVDTEDILTIPNILSFLRILLITPFMILFLNGNYIWASLMIIISGLTDCVDGFIARKFNQVSEFGKVLDPVADKLTLLAVGVGICIISPEVITVMVILIIKDILMMVGGLSLIKNDIKNWIDFNAGTIVTGDTFEQKLDELIKLVADTASGKLTVNERYNSREIAIFKTGVTL